MQFMNIMQLHKQTKDRQTKALKENTKEILEKNFT